MTIARVKPAGWAVNESLTSAQMNSVDTNVTNAVDKRSGQTDTVQSTLTFNTGTVTFAGTTTVSGALSASNVSQVQMSGTNKVTLASRSLTRTQRATPYNTNGNDTHWRAVGQGLWSNNVVGTNPNTFTNYVEIPIDLDNGVTITAVEVTIDPVGSHGALPANMPILSVYKTPIATGVPAAIGAPTVDPSANVAAYEAIHTITISGLSEVVDNTANHYGINLVPEAGANSRSGMQFNGCRVTFTTTVMNDGH